MAGTFEDGINWDLQNESGMSDLAEKMGNAAELNLGAPFALVLMALELMSEKVADEAAQNGGLARAQAIQAFDAFRGDLLESLEIVVSQAI